MKSRRWQHFFLVVAPVIFFSGCATSELWEEGRFARFHDPAHPANLRVFSSSEKKDFLVQYDELRDDNDSVRRRAYWLVENGEPVKNPHKPNFVAAEQAAGLDALPIFVPGLTPPSIVGLYVVALTNQTDFTLYADGKHLGDYELPVYGDSSGRTKQILLTPLAVVADITVIGGFVFLEMWASGSLNCVH